MGKHYGSVFYNEQELLKTILDIHNESKAIDLDPMYNKGMFYKDLIEKPRLRFDINADDKNYDCEFGDATDLPLDDKSVSSMILDPPFMFGVHGQTLNNIMTKRYTMYQDWQELKNDYESIINEAYRVLEPQGMLIFKCQDYTDSKTTFTHNLVYRLAVDAGFYAKDLAILVKENKIYNGNTTQRHLRKTHTYFYVFIKSRRKNYE